MGCVDSHSSIVLENSSILNAPFRSTYVFKEGFSCFLINAIAILCFISLTEPAFFVTLFMTLNNLSLH